MKNKIIIGVIIVILLGGGFFVFKNGNGIGTDDIQEVSRGDFITETEISGKIKPKKDSSLAFETQGTVKEILVEVGDEVEKGELLAYLNSNELQAQLKEALNDLEVERLTLEDLGSQNLSGDDLREEKTDSINTIKEAYTDASNAIYNYIDQFYSDPDSDRPKIKYSLDAVYDLSTSIELDRKKVGDRLSEWNEENKTLSLKTFTVEDINGSLEKLDFISTFLNDLAIQVSGFEPKPDYTQATINSYRSDVGSARNLIASAISSLTDAKASLRNTESEIPIQQTKVLKAEASVESIQAQIENTRLRAPFDGVISNIDIEEGEIALTNTPAISITDIEHLEIEAFIPEVSIAKVSVGNEAMFTLDAFGEKEDFKAIVSFIDPTETERDNVSTYRTLFDTENYDGKIKPGMTASIVITTSVRENVLTVPSRSVFEKDSEDFVKVYKKEGVEDRQVETGSLDTYGNREIISGLQVGEKVLLNPETDS